MARKTKKPLGSRADAAEQSVQQPLQPPPPAAKRGRPSNADRAAREAAASQGSTAPAATPAPPVVDPTIIKPEEMLGMTALFLVALSRGIKGDKPTREEIEQVNGPMTAVANKYRIISRWAPELALLGSLLVVAQSMRQRADEARALEQARAHVATQNQQSMPAWSMTDA